MDESSLDALQLQSRDFSLLSGLFESRVMTSPHIASLYFDGKAEYTKKRLQKLKAAGLIAERQRGVNERSVLFLTRQAYELLRKEGKLSNYPSLGPTAFESRVDVKELTLRHELDVMDVKAALHGALSTSATFSILEFTTWPLLCQFEVGRPADGVPTPVKPDGFIRIHEKEEGTKGYVYDCFLEVDRSNEVQETLVVKAECYREFYKSGGFAVRSGGSAEDFKAFPIRVLMVFKSAERRSNTAERLLQLNPPILTQVWLTTMSELTADPLGPVWILPADYRNAIVRSPFQVEAPVRRSVYRSRPEREIFIEGKIRKRSLFEGKAAGSPGESLKPLQPQFRTKYDG